jgi:hypothetical protein
MVMGIPPRSLRKARGCFQVSAYHRLSMLGWQQGHPACTAGDEKHERFALT